MQREQHFNRKFQTRADAQGCPLTTSCDCLEKPLKKAFGKLGIAVSLNPVPFIVFPLLISAALGSGLLFLTPVKDIEYLYTPTNGPAKLERTIIQDLFKLNNSGQFSPQRKTALDGTLTVILTSLSDNILQKDTFWEVIEIDTVVRNISLLNENITVTYENLCGNWDGVCEDSTLLKIYNREVKLLDTIALSYPVHNSKHWIGNELGGVSPEGEAVIVQSAKAIKLEYFVKPDEALAEKWLAECISVLGQLEKNHISLHYYSSKSMEDELDKSTKTVIPLFSITYTILITFSIISCTIIGDWVTSKPWLAFFGVLSAGLSVVSAFGLMCSLRVKFASQVAVMPFLALGIGVDDMFILISAWRRTNVYSSRHERMKEAMAEAGVSITMTSLTNTLAFGIGAITTFPSIQIFCLYTGAAMLFCYFYSITFFAGFMALFGLREERNLHCYLWCKECTPHDTDEHGYKGLCHKIWCMGGFRRQANPTERLKAVTPHSAMGFFKNYFGPFLMKPVVRVCVILLYFGYLGVAIYGCTKVREGLQLKHLAIDKSYVNDYYTVNDQYFSKYGPLVSIVIDSPLDYSNREVQGEVSVMLQKFLDDEHFLTTGLTSWMHTYLNFISKIAPQTVTTPLDLINSLKQFCEIPDFSRLCLDVKMNNTHVLASRYFVASRGLPSTTGERDMMLKTREIASSFPDMNVTVFHPAFIFFDQYVVILSNTLQNMGIAVVCMFFLSLLLLSNPVCSVWVVLAIVSIETGVLGYMTLWDVNLDSISMINLILCIGFSVDYAAHITYSFTSSSGPTGAQRSIDALYELGFPVLQGAASTILGVLVLASSPSYIFRTFFKTMFLVILFGAIHGVIFLPVVLSLLGTCTSRHGDSVTHSQQNKTSTKPQNRFRIPPSHVHPNPIYYAPNFKMPYYTPYSENNYWQPLPLHYPYYKRPW